ncbi:hypothetical protein [Streptomyces sp. NPDC059783]|uniref:hypothetical protein n=1 Tax=Streptomyces sp. NPDC059783 TaxID=3346944 RepID=UPI003669379D
MAGLRLVPAEPGDGDRAPVARFGGDGFVEERAQGACWGKAGSSIRERMRQFMTAGHP